MTKVIPAPKLEELKIVVELKETTVKWHRNITKHNVTYDKSVYSIANHGLTMEYTGLS